MEEIPGRSGEMCTRCGTPLEPAELNPTSEPDADEVVLRCANGHEIRVTRHHDKDEAGALEP